MPPSTALHRTGRLTPSAYLKVLVLAALVMPVAFFHRTLRDPLNTVPAGISRPGPGYLGDPAICTSVLGRLWDRLERGEPWNTDDRVFAPYRDTWALGESSPLPALIALPFARLTGSPPFGHDVVFLLACVLVTIVSGSFYARLAGPGWPALLAAVLFTWGPGRLNNFGVLQTMWGGLMPLSLCFAVDYLKRPRPRTALLFGSSFLVLGLGSLYGLLMGSIVAGLFLAALAAADRRPRVLAGLVAAGLGAAILLLLAYRPLFAARRDFGARFSMATLEGQAGDLMSLLHHGIFSGPARTLLEAIEPHLPEGSSALFPTFLALLCFGLALWGVRGRARRLERQPWLWLVLALLCFLFALGPTIRLAGRPVMPGPWRLLAQLPVFDSVRGLNRWDQWFDFSLMAFSAIVLGRALRALPPRRGRWLLGTAAALVAFDVFPRPVPALTLPRASVFSDVLRALPRSAIVGTFPFTPDASVRAWVEQLDHGRRVLTGYQTFPPPIHRWLEREAREKPLVRTLAIYRELGVSVVEIDLRSLDGPRRVEVEALPAGLPFLDAEPLLRRGDRLLLTFRNPREPVLLDPRRGGLTLKGRSVELPGPPGRLAFRLGPETFRVLVRAGGSLRESELSFPITGVGGLRGLLAGTPADDAEILDPRSGRTLLTGR